jgi:zinc D-Ala-D-Ala carboxypeptidase
MRKRNINLYKKYIIMTTKTIQNSVHAIAHDINSSTPNTLSPNTYLTSHFRLIEFTRSGEATQRGLDNTPGKAEIEALRALCENILEPMRHHFGAIYITSGYRSRRVNNAVGGVGGSQHIRGEAADILLSTFDDWREAVEFVKHLDFDQLIIEPLHDPRPRWLHVSYTKRHRNRHEIILGDHKL